MKILVVPDSFKGTLTSGEVCEYIKAGIKEYAPENEIITLPFSDGGEGFAECMKSICKGDVLYTKCHDIYNRLIEGYITVFGEYAVIETAVASGLQKNKRVMAASSYGTGELIRFAAENGYKNIILGLGGSGCCDGGAGALSALGAKFYDESYKRISFVKGSDLNYIFGAGFIDCVKGVNFTFACDVENEYCGKNGAAYVFAPQKGASEKEVAELDEGLKRLNAFLPTDISALKGAGAAGGICGGLYSVYGGEIKSGFEVLSEHAGLEELIKGCDLVVTGEGKTDEQTLMGKLPYRIAELAKKHGKRCVVISGVNEGIEIGDKCISLADAETSIDEAINNAEEILTKKAKYILQ